LVNRIPNNRRLLLVCAALVLITFAAFYPVFECGFVTYDDPAYVYSNPPVRDGLSWAGIQWAFTAMHASNWHPLTWLSHALDCQLFGLNPAGHHATNLLLHTLNALLVFATLRKLTDTFWRSAFVAALFAIHPMHVESVAWVSERKDVLSVFFGLLAILAYAKYSSPTPRSALHAPHSAPSSILHPLSSKWYWLALLCFALSLLSKPMLVTLPCLLLLLDFWPLQRIQPTTINLQRPVLLKLLLEKLPFFLLVLGSIPLTLLAQAKGGSVVPIGDISLAQRLANSAIAGGWYVGKLFWPVDLAVIYPLFPTRDPAQIFAGAVVLLGFSWLAVWQVRRRPYVFAGWFWYLGTLVPVIGLVQVGMQTYADRYTYFPYIGLGLVLAWALAEWVANSDRRRYGVGVLSVIALGVCVAVTNHQCRYWRNSETLFARAISVTEGNYVALNNLGFALAERKEFSRAIENYRQALAVTSRFAEAMNNLGCAYMGLKEFDQAIPVFREALSIKPDDVRTLNNLGSALHESGDYTNAIAEYNEALRLDPKFAQANYNLANSLAAVGKVTEALTNYQQALALEPDYADAHLNLGVELWKLGRKAAAADHFQRALAARTNYPGAHFWLATVAREAGDAVSEEKHLRQFLTAEPDHASARTKLAVALASRQQTDAALQEVREAIRRQPAYAPAQYCLGVLLEQAGRPAEAIAAYDAALRIQSDYPEVLNNLAWLLAANADAKLRDGTRAVKLAHRACERTEFKVPVFIGTLAAAYAEAGQFPEAATVAEQAAKAAEAAGDQELAARNRKFMEWYRTRKTWREGNAER